MSNKVKRSVIRYSEEFKKSSVKLALGSEESIKQISLNIGVCRSTLSKWLSDYTSSKKNDADVNCFEEIKRLKKDLQQVRLERDLLKKAAAYFAKESQ